MDYVFKMSRRYFRTIICVNETFYIVPRVLTSKQNPNVKYQTV